LNIRLFKNTHLLYVYLYFIEIFLPPTIPMANPAAKELSPQHNPAARCLYPNPRAFLP
jgi:hypothetical protein